MSSLLNESLPNILTIPLMTLHECNSRAVVFLVASSSSVTLSFLQLTVEATRTVVIYFALFTSCMTVHKTGSIRTVSSFKAILVLVTKTLSTFIVVFILLDTRESPQTVRVLLARLVFSFCIDRLKRQNCQQKDSREDNN